MAARAILLVTAVGSAFASSSGCSLRRLHGTSNSLDWRKDALRVVREMCLKAADNSCADRDIYQFGVFGGKSVKQMLFAANCSKTPVHTFWGFDSFQGLPDEDKSNFTGGVDKKYGAGKYSSSAALKLTGKALFDRIERYIGFDQRVRWVKGFYNESLTRDLARQRGMRPASYVDIDADLYTSSAQALEWLVASGLIVAGTVIGYDDWSFSDQANGGEKRAHEEIIARAFGRRVERLAGCGPNAACFQVS